MTYQPTADQGYILVAEIPVSDEEGSIWVTVSTEVGTTPAVVCIDLGGHAHMSPATTALVSDALARAADIVDLITAARVTR